MNDVIVVGGGIAGLVAARELAIGGLSVTVLEATGVLGGRVARHTVAGIDLDAGAESFATRSGTVAAYLAELGLADAIVNPNPAGAWLQPANGPAIPMPKTGLLGIPGTPLARDVIAAIKLPGALRAQLDVFLPRGFGATQTSLGGLVRARMGVKVLDKLVAPVATGIHSRHPDVLLVDAVSPGLRAALAETGSLSRAVRTLRAAAPAGSAVAGIDGGMYRLVEALEADLQTRGVRVRTGTRVVDVATGRVELATGEVLEACAVVLAAQLNAALGPEPAPAPAGNIVLATLVVDSPALDAAPRGTGLLVAPVAGIAASTANAAGSVSSTPASSTLRAKALTHATSKWPWLAAKAGAHRHVIRLSYNNAPENDFAEMARADAQRLLGVPIPAGSVLGFARVVWPAPAPSQTASTAAPSGNRPAPRAGIRQIGEPVAGTGLAAVIAQARREAVSLLTELAE